MTQKYALTITLADLRQHNACGRGYQRLADALGPEWPDDAPIKLVDCLQSNPVQDVLWALRATAEDPREAARMITADIAESVLHIYEEAHPGDDRPRKAIEAARMGDAEGARIAARAADAAADAAAYAARAARAARAADAAAYAARAARAADAAYAAAYAARAADAAADEREKQAAIIRKWLC